MSVLSKNTRHTSQQWQVDNIMTGGEEKEAEERETA